MKTSLLALVVLLIQIGSAVAGEEPLDVLFIGNSYTYGNDLPGIIEAMAAAGGGRKIAAERSVHGGFTLQKHFEKGEGVEKIRSKRWDVVVLQEQSQMPCVNPKLMHQFARKLHAEIAKQHAETVFFLTWARQHIPEMQQGLNDGYFKIAKELDAKVAPVGVAWKNALAADGKLVLHRADKSHPNSAGSYLAACVFYATLLESSPVGLPAELEKGGKLLVKLDAKLAGQLQKIAQKTVEDLPPGRVPDNRSDIGGQPPGSGSETCGQFCSEDLP